MEYYYEKWLQQEKDWIKAIESERKKKAWIHAAVAVICCVAALAGIGVMAGGTKLAVSNIKYGLILGVFSGGLYLVIMYCSGTAKRYIKRLEKEIAGEIKTSEERENFARSMLEEAEAACVEFVRAKGAVPERFCVSSDIALLRGMIPSMVHLNKTEKIETDVVQSVNTIRAGGYKIRVNYNSYPVYFYYDKSQAETDKNKKQKVDKVMVFPSREIRDEAARMMSRPQE